jgi:PTH1 family peptidyl-tRNA hydrolase
MPDSPENSGPRIRQEASAIRLLAGLGNPGRDYDGTRHNIGFAVLDRVASLLGVSFAKEPKWASMIAKVSGSGIVLLKPTTFMNLSGEAVAEYARFFRIPHESVLVVLDDVALPLGALRLRCEGGSGGQKGLESVLMHFATEQVPRLRVGIGAYLSGEGDLSSHVLSRFRPEEQSTVDAAVLRAAEAAVCTTSEGLERAMNLYNATPTPSKSGKTTANQP